MIEKLIALSKSIILMSSELNIFNIILFSSNKIFYITLKN